MMSEALLLALVAAALLATIALSALSALIERSGPIRLRHWGEEAGGSLRRLQEDPGRFDSFRFLLSWSARLALLGLVAAVAVLLAALGVARPMAWAVAAVAVLAGVLEAVNRHLVGRDPEAALRRLTAPTRALLLLLGPTLGPLRLLLPARVRGGEGGLSEEATKEEIEAFIAVGRREGILEPEEEELVRGVVDFGNTQVRSVMTPRVDMVTAPVDTPAERLAELVLSTGHSRIPLYEESIDQIVGVLHVRDLLRFLHRGNGHQDLRSLLQPIHFVPETKSLAHLLRELQERHQEMAIVVDEYGGTEGIVTTEDLLEEIFGEIADEHDPFEPEEVQLPDGSWRVDGRTHLEDLEELFPVEVDEEPYETVGGLIFGMLGHVPRVGDEVEAFGLRFLVEGADHRRARRVRISRLPPAAVEEGEA